MEKKALKISLSTFFLILAIIVIIVMGFFMFKLYNDKNTEVQKSAKLSEEVQNLNSELNTLQDKINTISNTISSNETEVTSTNTISSNGTEVTPTNSNTSEVKFTDYDIQNALLQYLELYGDSHCSALLGNLSQKGLLPSYDSLGLIDGLWTKTTLKYSDYKDAMLHFVSEKEYERYWKTGVESIKETGDGYVAWGQGGGDRPNFLVTNVTKTGENSYTGTYDLFEASDLLKMKKTGTETCTFTVTSYNRRCVIDSISGLKI